MDPSLPVSTEVYYAVGSFLSPESKKYEHPLVIRVLYFIEKMLAYILQSPCSPSSSNMKSSRVYPPYSPDLNPIEHAWVLLKRQVHIDYPELATTLVAPGQNPPLCVCDLLLYIPLYAAQTGYDSGSAEGGAPFTHTLFPNVPCARTDLTGHSGPPTPTERKKQENTPSPLQKREGERSKGTFPHRLRPESSLLHLLSRVRLVPDLLPGPALDVPSLARSRGPSTTGASPALLSPPG